MRVGERNAALWIGGRVRYGKFARRRLRIALRTSRAALEPFALRGFLRVGLGNAGPEPAQRTIERREGAVGAERLLDRRRSPFACEARPRGSRLHPRQNGCDAAQL